MTRTVPDFLDQYKDRWFSPTEFWRAFRIPGYAVKNIVGFNNIYDSEEALVSAWRDNDEDRFKLAKQQDLSPTNQYGFRIVSYTFINNQFYDTEDQIYVNYRPLTPTELLMETP